MDFSEFFGNDHAHEVSCAISLQAREEWNFIILLEHTEGLSGDRDFSIRAVLGALSPFDPAKFFL